MAHASELEMIESVPKRLAVATRKMYRKSIYKQNVNILICKSIRLHGLYAAAAVAAANKFLEKRTLTEHRTNVRHFAHNNI